MIQRKQTLWLLISSIAAFLTLQFPFYTGNIIDEKGLKSFVELNGKFNILLIITTVATAVISIITIFLYNDRKRQIVFSSINLIISFIIIALYFWQKQKFTDGAISLTSILTFIIPIFIILAIIGIYKDEKLIKSVSSSRLR